jgi:uncharacterized membrane protein YfcA
MDIGTLLLLLVGGVFSGIVNAIIGGGSLISVPLLIFLGLEPHMAIGTNRFAMIFNTGVGAVDYYGKVKYSVKLALALALVASGGSYLGANLVLQTAEATLKYMIGILMLVMGGVVVYKRKLGLEEKELNPTKVNYCAMSIVAFFLGIYGGFYGAGISTLFTFVFISFLGMSFIKSAGITRFIVSILSMIAFSVFLVNMKIDLPYGIVLLVSFVAGAKIGVQLALRAGNVWIRRLFVLLVIVSSVRLLTT